MSTGLQLLCVDTDRGSVPVHTSGLVKAVSAPICGNQVVYRTPTESDASTRVCTCMLMSVDNSN